MLTNRRLTRSQTTANELARRQSRAQLSNPQPASTESIQPTSSGSMFSSMSMSLSSSMSVSNAGSGIVIPELQMLAAKYAQQLSATEIAKAEAELSPAEFAEADRQLQSDQEFIDAKDECVAHFCERSHERSEICESPDNVECSKCKRKFHVECARISERMLKKTAEGCTHKFVCDGCKPNIIVVYHAETGKPVRVVYAKDPNNEDGPKCLCLPLGEFAKQQGDHLNNRNNFGTAFQKRSGCSTVSLFLPDNAVKPNASNQKSKCMKLFEACNVNMSDPKLPTISLRFPTRTKRRHDVSSNNRRVRQTTVTTVTRALFPQGENMAFYPALPPASEQEQGEREGESDLMMPLEHNPELLLVQVPAFRYITPIHQDAAVAPEPLSTLDF